MGYYLQAPTHHNKAKYLLTKFGGKVLSCIPISISDVPDQAVVCVVDNGLFEAAAVAYSDGELAAFNRHGDNRPKIWLVLDNRQKVYDEAGVSQEDR